MDGFHNAIELMKKNEELKYVDAKISENSRYNIKRVYEFTVFTSNEIKNCLKNN